MSRTMLAALTLLAAGGLRSGRQADVASADSLSRDLQLAPVDTSATLNDRPSADTATAADAGARADADRRPPSRPRRSPKPKPKPAAGAGRPGSGRAAGARAGARAPSGARCRARRFSAATDAEIRSHKNKVGDEVTATVGDRREGRRRAGW